MKKTRFYWILASAPLFLLVVYLIFQGAREIEEAKVKEVPYSKSDAYQEMTGLVFSEYSFGNKKMEVKAEKVSIRPKKVGFFKTPLIKEAHMVKPEILFFADGERASHITADSGKMNMGNRRLLLKGNVILVTAEDKRLSTKEMALDPKLGLLSIRGRFILKKDGDIIKGKGLRSDIRLEKLMIKKEGG